MAQAINFPNNPTLNMIHKDWNGIEWICKDATFGDVRWARSGQSSKITAGDVLYDPTDDAITDADNVQDALIEHSEAINYKTDISSGLRDGGVITKNSNTTFNITAGDGMIVNNWTDVDNPSFHKVAWLDFTNITLTTDVNSDVGQTHILIDGTGSIIQIIGDLTSAQLKTNIVLGIVFYVNDIINDVGNTPKVINQTASNVDDLMLLNQQVKGFNPHGVVTNPISLSIYTDSGTIFYPGINFRNDRANPNLMDISGIGDVTTPSNLVIITGTGSVSSTGTTIPKNINTIGDTIVALGGTAATIHRLYISGFNTGSSKLILQLGQFSYTSATIAKNNLTDDEAQNDTNAEIDQMFFLGWICVSGTAGDFVDPTLAWIIPAGNDVSGGGGGSTPAVTSHDTLTSRSLADQHPIGAITDLQTELDRGGRIWLTAMDYKIGDIVTGTTSGKIFTCINGHTSTNSDLLGGADAGNWKETGEKERGGIAWLDIIAYTVGDVVTDGGVLYTCIVSHTGDGLGNNRPSVDLTNWTTSSDNERGGIAWITAESYEIGDIVTDTLTGLVYSCSAAHISTTDVATDIANWSPIYKVISDTAPLNPIIGQEWTYSVNMIDYTWYNDGLSSQWVEI